MTAACPWAAGTNGKDSHLVFRGNLATLVFESGLFKGAAKYSTRFSQMSGTFLVAELELIIPPLHRPSACASHSAVQAAVAVHLFAPLRPWPSQSAPKPFFLVFFLPRPCLRLLPSKQERDLPDLLPFHTKQPS